MNIHPPEAIASLGEDYVSLWHSFTVFPTREEISQKIRIYKPRTLANLDCKGRGPGGLMKVGGKVCYPRDEVVLWLASQVKVKAAA